MNTPPLVFNRALLQARRYRALAMFPKVDFLLSHAADEIAERLELIKRSFPVSLDLAGYTGLIAERLASHPGIDIVVRAESIPAMLRNWPGAKVVCDLEALPFGNETLNLVTSALSLHLVNDLPGSLIQIAHALRPDGLFLGILLGTATLSELREVLILAETETIGGAGYRIAPFVDVQSMGSLLQRAGFALPVIDSEKLTVSYADIFALMRDLRAMGMSNMLHARSRRPLRRDTLWRAAELYKTRFANESGRICATFELIHICGWKPHSSQQASLPPGSARMKLADALGTQEETP